MRAIAARITGVSGFRLGGLSAGRRRNRSDRGPRLKPVAPNTQAAIATVIDLATAAYHPDGDSVRLQAARCSSNGSVTVLSGKRLQYSSSRIFLGQETVSVVLIDSLGVSTLASLQVRVDPNPLVGVPFEDQMFFDDQTGWDDIASWR